MLPQNLLPKATALPHFIQNVALKLLPEHANQNIFSVSAANNWILSYHSKQRKEKAEIQKPGIKPVKILVCCLQKTQHKHNTVSGMASIQMSQQAVVKSNHGKQIANCSDIGCTLGEESSLPYIYTNLTPHGSYALFICYYFYSYIPMRQIEERK